MSARLIVTADDYGYSRRYNEGILRAIESGAIDATSAMVLREACDPLPLLDAGAEVGLHLELEPGLGADEAKAEPQRQLDLFEAMFGRPPAYLDGHLHSHATEPAATEVIALARERGMRVRGADEWHRARLRESGVLTPERLIGRYEPSQPVIPAEISSVAAGGEPPAGLTEWMTHPGLSDRESGSSFDAGRERDLAALLRLAPSPFLRRWRSGG
jgi:predicted glycoside hydrolase/deacetylase ChbG (UPF0249 family)